MKRILFLIVFLPFWALAQVPTSSTQQAVGTDAQRPGSPKTGEARWNTTCTCLEIWNGSAWAQHADLSVSNEGSLTVGAGSSTTSLIQSNTSGSTAVTLEAGTNITLSESGNTITISASSGTATVGDGDYGDITVSGSGTVWSIDAGVVGATELASTAVTPGSYTLANITVDSDGRITAASNGTDNELTQEEVEDFVGGMVTGNTETGITVTYQDIDGTLDFVATDPSLSNEGSLTVGAGASNTSLIQSNTSGSTAVTLQAGTNITLAEAGNTITITAAGDGTGTDDQTLSWNGGTGELSIEDGNTVDLDGRYLQTEVDGSVTNEAWTIDATGGDTEVVSNQTILFVGSGAVSTSYSSATNTLTITGTDTNTQLTEEQVEDFVGGMVTGNTETGITVTYQDIDGTLDFVATDPSLSNEGSLTVGAGAANTSLIQSNTSGSTAVTLSGGTGVQITESGSTITISATGTTLNSQTGTSYTLVLADAGKLVTMTNSSANTLTVPPNSSVAFPVGTVVNIASLGAGQTTVAPGSGVTVGSADSKLKLRVQYSSGSLIKTATDTWLLVGDITD